MLCIYLNLINLLLKLLCHLLVKLFQHLIFFLHFFIFILNFIKSFVVLFWTFHKLWNLNFDIIQLRLFLLSCRMNTSLCIYVWRRSIFLWDLLYYLNLFNYFNIWSLSLCHILCFGKIYLEIIAIYFFIR